MNDQIPTATAGNVLRLGTAIQCRAWLSPNRAERIPSTAGGGVSAPPSTTGILGMENQDTDSPPRHDHPPLACEVTSWFGASGRAQSDPRGFSLTGPRCP